MENSTVTLALIGDDAALPLASLIGSMVFGGIALILSGKNAQRVDKAFELSASALAFNELSKRVTNLEDENKQLKREVADCKSRETDLLERLVKALAGRNIDL